MIRINLLPGQKKKRSAGGGASFSLPDLSELREKIQDPLLAGAVGAIVLGIGATVGIYMMERGKVESVGPVVEQLERDNRRFARQIELRDQEGQLVDSLSRELGRIRRIDADRYIWPHIMEELARALPEFTWLETVENIAQAPDPFDPRGGDDGEEETELQFEPPPSVQVMGRTSDMQYYTRFLRRLSESPWLGVAQGGTTQLIQEENRTVYSFSITVPFQRADSIFIETVPVISSVR